MPDSTRLRIASVFSETPFGRIPEEGPDNGQRFREEFLLPRLTRGETVILDIDGVAGLPSSFWEETLGGAVRRGVSGADMRRLVTIETSQPDLEIYVRIGWLHVERAEKELAQTRH